MQGFTPIEGLRTYYTYTPDCVKYETSHALVASCLFCSYSHLYIHFHIRITMKHDVLRLRVIRSLSSIRSLASLPVSCDLHSVVYNSRLSLRMYDTTMKSTTYMGRLHTYQLACTGHEFNCNPDKHGHTYALS